MVKSFELAKEFGMKYITSEPRKDLWDMIDTLAGQYGIKVAIHEHARPNLYWHPDSVLAAIKGHKKSEPVPTLAIGPEADSIR
jgi:hypothetical protein